MPRRRTGSWHGLVYSSMGGLTGITTPDGRDLGRRPIRGEIEVESLLGQTSNQLPHVASNFGKLSGPRPWQCDDWLAAAHTREPSWGVELEQRPMAMALV